VSSLLLLLLLLYAVSVSAMSMMNPTHQHQQVSPPPAGIENVYVIPGPQYRGQVMMTLNPNARRKLKIFSVIMLLCGPLFVIISTACVLLDGFQLLHGFFAGILVSILHVALVILLCDSYARVILVILANDPSLTMLRAAANGNYVVPRTNRRLGDRAFSVAAPKPGTVYPQTSRSLPAQRMLSNDA